MEVNWSYQSSETFICGRLWESFLKGKAVFENQEWLAGEIGCGNSNYYFFIFQALPHSDDISIISRMLGIIIVRALEDADELHSANELQHIQNSES